MQTLTAEYRKTPVLLAELGMSDTKFTCLGSCL